MIYWGYMDHLWQKSVLDGQFSFLHLSSLTTILRRGLEEVVTFVLLFHAMRFQMIPQSACLRGCIVTLVAFF